MVDAPSPHPRANVPRCLTIAGSDSGGGAGIQADLKTFQAIGVYGASAITAVTSQNTLGVTRVDPIPPEGISAQIEAVLGDIGADAVKIGMLGGEAAVATVAAALRRFAGIPVVLDPVMVAKGGAHLLEPGAERALAMELLPLAQIVTPNVPETAALLGRPFDPRSAAEVEAACQAIGRWGARAILVKGGHAAGPTVRDWLWSGRHLRLFEHPRRDARSSHGTGCTLSAAIAAYLALGHDLEGAVERALDYLDGALAAAQPIGAGIGPVRHDWNLQRRNDRS